MIANLPLGLDLVAVACERGQDITSQVAQHLAQAFGVFNSWRFIADLADAGIIVVTPTRRVVWTDLGRRLYRDIDQVLATVDDLEGHS